MRIEAYAVAVVAAGMVSLLMLAPDAERLKHHDPSHVAAERGLGIAGDELNNWNVVCASMDETGQNEPSPGGGCLVRYLDVIESFEAGSGHIAASVVSGPAGPRVEFNIGPREVEKAVSLEVV